MIDFDVAAAIIDFVIEEPNPVVLLEPGETDKPEVTDAADLYKPPSKSWLCGLLVLVLLGGTFWIGWRTRTEGYLTAESGLGYALGIVGSVLMLMLFLYPARKNLRFMRGWGDVRHWYLAHVALGISGPILILFHANFQVGSINSSFVLGATLLVVMSGFLGVHTYRKIHYGLHNKLSNLRALREEVEMLRSNSMFVLGFTPEMQDRLLAFQAAVLKPPHGITHSITRLLTIGLWTRWTYFRLILILRRTLRAAAKRSGWPLRERRRQGKAARQHIRTHLDTIQQSVQFGFYERLSALWHMFHMPLFLVLVLALIVHIIAVHMF